MFQSIEMKKISGHKSRGEVNDLTPFKKTLSAQHNYWLYLVQVQNQQRGELLFTMMVTKQAFPDEKLADHLAETLGIQETMSRLDNAGAGGKQISFPVLNEGWVML